MSKPVIKSISSEAWVWLSDHRSLRVKYYIVVPEGRSIKIGISALNRTEPWGFFKRLSASQVVTFYGWGSLCAKVDDYQGLCMVTVYKNIDPTQITSLS